MLFPVFHLFLYWSGMYIMYRPQRKTISLSLMEYPNTEKMNNILVLHKEKETVKGWQYIERASKQNWSVTNIGDSSLAVLQMEEQVCSAENIRIC